MFGTDALLLTPIRNSKIFFHGKELNPLNPEQLQYENGLLTLTVLGGIKLEGLDRMRVTLKAEIPFNPCSYQNRNVNGKPISLLEKNANLFIKLSYTYFIKIKIA